MTSLFTKLIYNSIMNAYILIKDLLVRSKSQILNYAWNGSRW